MMSALFHLIDFVKRFVGLNVDSGVGSDVKGEVVYGKRKDQTTPSYIPFSKNSGDSPVIATEQFAVPKVGFNVATTMSINGVTKDNKVQISMANSGYNNAVASMDLSSTSQYLNIGGREFNLNSYRGIGMGYLLNPNLPAPVFVGMQEMDDTNSTVGDFVVGTRSTTDTSAPTIRFRVDNRGQILGEGDYTPSKDNSLVTKRYVDELVKKEVEVALSKVVVNNTTTLPTKTKQKIPPRTP